jgi:hypothetical protein
LAVVATKMGRLHAPADPLFVSIRTVTYGQRASVRVQKASASSDSNAPSVRAGLREPAGRLAHSPSSHGDSPAHTTRAQHLSTSTKLVHSTAYSPKKESMGQTRTRRCSIGPQWISLSRRECPCPHPRGSSNVVPENAFRHSSRAWNGRGSTTQHLSSVSPLSCPTGIMVEAAWS